jgi:hypothetical protein
MFCSLIQDKNFYAYISRQDMIPLCNEYYSRYIQEDIDHIVHDVDTCGNLLGINSNY